MPSYSDAAQVSVEAFALLFEHPVQLDQLLAVRAQLGTTVEERVNQPAVPLPLPNRMPNRRGHDLFQR